MIQIASSRGENRAVRDVGREVVAEKHLDNTTIMVTTIPVIKIGKNIIRLVRPS